MGAAALLSRLLPAIAVIEKTPYRIAVRCLFLYGDRVSGFLADVECAAQDTSQKPRAFDHNNLHTENLLQRIAPEDDPLPL